jgi:hypothetical protein
MSGFYAVLGLVVGASNLLFIALFVTTVRDLEKVERERDALWDELHGADRA